MVSLQGGVKAVVWTDVMQMSIAIMGMIALSIVGIAKAGGISEVSPNKFPLEFIIRILNVILSLAIHLLRFTRKFQH